MTETPGSDALIDIGDVNEQLKSSIQGKLSRGSLWNFQCCIFRVPATLRRHNKSVYEPHTVSIGPFHHGKEELKGMEKIKLWYLQDLLSRAPTPNTSLEVFIKHIRGLENFARDCYAEPIHDLEGDKFVEMMVVDGCFIIELLRKNPAKTVPIERNDPASNMPWAILALYNDMLLLENQLPWCVLECLFNLTTVYEEGTPSLADLALNFFKTMTLMTVRAKPNSRISETKHLIDLVRTSLLSPVADEKRECPVWEVIPSMTDLLQSGVKFKVGNPQDILNVKFNRGVLEIPPIFLQENAESIFRNLIAFEQCDPWCTHDITSFAVLLDNLINTSKDVDFLSQKGIIVNVLSNEDISLFFNRLYNDCLFESFSYRQLSQELNKYCRKPWNRRCATLKREYFNTPWSILSFIAALLILLFTFAQTLFAILSYN
ncbi:hypothetical protein HHK36_029317 [Tetracentron sinense]|uniref:Uncharacterized protein n=1 Tax=Tetracentron sinense TaxID=13715 RepID=A0A834YEY6_TETSI|nr:hypothetical protein HHK36_029317 [Tetracentron sinense]